MDYEKLFGLMCSFIFIFLFLNSCSNYSVSCPTTVKYTEEQEADIIKEVEKIDPQSILIIVISDYISVRDQIKVCNR